MGVAIDVPGKMAMMSSDFVLNRIQPLKIVIDPLVFLNHAGITVKPRRLFLAWFVFLLSMMLL